MSRSLQRNRHKKGIHKRKTNAKRSLRKITPFALVCGVVACTYFIYRISMVALPVVILGEEYTGSSKAQNVVCGSQEDTNHIHDSKPIISDAYQKSIKTQKHLGPNMIKNPDLTYYDDTGVHGYEHTVDNSNVLYQRSWDQNTTSYFLHLENMQPKTTAQDTAAGWITDKIKIIGGETYAYGFAYRSNVPLQLSLETIVQGVSTYSNITELPTSNVWRDFSTHFQNAENASAMRIIVTAQDPGEFDIQKYTSYQIPSARLPQAMVSITFDDGWQSIYDKALPLLQKHNLRSTQFIISEVSQKKTSGYMNLGTASKMHLNGMEIGSHSLRHCNQTSLARADIYRDAKDSRNILRDENLGPINIYAYPLGQYNEKTQSIISKQYDFIRTSDEGYNDRYFDPEAIKSMSILNTTKIEELKKWLNYASQHKIWLVIAYHRVDETGEYSVTSSQLNEQLHAIKQSNIKTIPLGEAAREIKKK